MGARKQRRIRVREDRLSPLDGTKMEVAIWLLAKRRVEDRTQRPQPSPPPVEDDHSTTNDGVIGGDDAASGEAA